VTDGENERSSSPPRPRELMASAVMDNRELDRIVQHIGGAIDSSLQREEPFYHLQLSNVFPGDLYAQMLEAMPVKDDYRVMSGRTKSTRTKNGGGTRTKIDLFPEYIRHLPAQKNKIWEVVGRALCSKQVRDAFIGRLEPGLQRRFGLNCCKVGMYPIPILTRDVPGYSIGIHPDTHWKGMTIQLYLPRDNSIQHVGTIFHKRTGDKTYAKALQMSFAPNTGYAFAVDKDTYHSVETVGLEVNTRDSILLTYFVDKTPLQIVRNRGRRLGNFILNEIRSITRALRRDGEPFNGCSVSR
jgi:hypothetical protein